MTTRQTLVGHAGGSHLALSCMTYHLEIMTPVLALQFSSSCLEVKRFKADKEAHRTGALLRFHFTACVEPRNTMLQ